MFNQINVLGLVLYVIFVIFVCIFWYMVYKGWGTNPFAFFNTERLKSPNEAVPLERLCFILLTFLLTMAAILPIIQVIVSSMGN